MHHNVFFNTERIYMHPNASPEGAGRMPPREDEWRFQNGTLGAAMRLKALSQAPPEITRHSKTSRQAKNKQNPKQNIHGPHNHPHKCSGKAFLPST